LRRLERLKDSGNKGVEEARVKVSKKKNAETWSKLIARRD